MVAVGACSLVRRVLLALLSSACVLTTGVITNEEWTATINKAGRQRMLSQKMSKEFLLVALGLNKDEDKALMEATVTEFDDSLSKLRSGSSGDTITGPPNQGISNQLGTVQGLWDEFKGLLSSNVDASPIGANVLSDLATKSVTLLDETNLAVGMYAAAASAAGAGLPGATVNVAGRQRMLSQKMSKEAFLVALDVEVSDSKASLAATKALFKSSFEGLVLGSSTLGVTKTTDACILQQMGTVDRLWRNFEPLLDKVLESDGSVASEDLEKIREQNPTLLTEMNTAVTLYAEDSTGTVSCQLPSPTAAEYAAVINIAGRQRMLSQKMSKELFMIALGKPLESKMEATMAEFHTVLKRLLLGSRAEGLPAPPNQQVAGQLGVVVDNWLPLHKTMLAVLSSGYVSEDNISIVAAGNVPLLVEMNRGVNLYTSAATSAGAGLPSAVVDKSGRQRMLTQKMSKEAMLVQLDHMAAENRATLVETIQEFDEVLKGLIDGSDKHQLPATREACILLKLAEVEALWGPFQRVLTKFSDGSATDEDVTTVVDTNEPLLGKMNEAVFLYAEAASNAVITCDTKGSTDAAWGGFRPASTALAFCALLWAAFAHQR